MRFHKKPPKKYGFFDFAIDVITIPIAVAIWILEKILNGIDKAC